MRKLKYKKIDAFTAGDSLGNPAACIYLELGKTISVEDMQKIAKDHKGFVSEVVYMTDSDSADCKLTYFSSECEVDFCGHGTMALMYDLVKNNETFLNKDTILFETNKKGTLTLLNRINEEDAIYIEAPNPLFYKVPVKRKEIADALGIEENAISEKYEMDFIDAGLRTLIVPIMLYEDEISIFPCEKELKQFCLARGIDIILIFSKIASLPRYMAHTRVFAPRFGYLEDPATGSGNSAFGNYLLKYNLWDGSPIVLEQGGNDRIYNEVKLVKKNNQILFGGKASVHINGEYLL